MVDIYKGGNKNLELNVNGREHYYNWYLGNWQLKDLKDPISRADAAAGSNELFPNLELADETEASEPMASLGPQEKAAI